MPVSDKNHGLVIGIVVGLGVVIIIVIIVIIFFIKKRFEHFFTFCT